MDRMASKIDSMEAEIDAMRELSDIDPRRSQLEDVFRKMETRQRPSDGASPSRSRNEPPDDLADLKKKFE